MTNPYGNFKSDISLTSDQLRKKLLWDSSHAPLEHVLQNFNCFVAGGFALHCFSPDQRYGDVDFFFSSEEEKEKALEYIKTVLDYPPSDDPTQGEPYMGNTIRAHTFQVKGTVFQFIKAVHGDVQRVLETFDFENVKVALVWDHALGNYTLVYSPLLPELLSSKKVLFRRQSHAVLETPEDKQVFAKQNLNRLDKYLVRFPGGFWDAESREHIFLQYAFNVKYKKTNTWNHARLEHHGVLRKLLLAENTTLEELILFYPLGGDYKKLFDARSKGEVWAEPLRGYR